MSKPNLSFLISWQCNQMWFIYTHNLKSEYHIDITFWLSIFAQQEELVPLVFSKSKELRAKSKIKVLQLITYFDPMLC
jgi:hypothetical protein